MSKQYKTLIYSRILLLGLFMAALAILVARNVQTSWNIFLAVMGFSAVVFIHECGHFVVAKACDIKVEVFSIFIPPVLAGIRRTPQGFRVRILPNLFPKDNDPDGDGLLSFTFGPKGKPGETEYRVGLIPVAGYVKMLGQDDTSADKQSEDPRSFGNKSTGARMAVIAAGVTFNIILAVVLMMGLYLVGLPRTPAVVGGVIPGSPAADAGLQVGDRITKIGNKAKHLEYTDIMAAAALSNKGQAIPITVERRNGTKETLSLVAKDIDGVPVRLFGLYPPSSLTVAQVKQPNMLLKNTGLKAGDRVVAVDGQPIEHYWQLEEYVSNTYEPNITLTVERPDKAGAAHDIDIHIPLVLSNANSEVASESDLNSICSLVPRLVITTVSEGGPSTLRAGDIIVAIDDVNDPTYKEMRDETTAYDGKDLPLTVLRTNTQGQTQRVKVMVVPKRAPGSDRVVIGIGVALDALHPVVAKAIATNQDTKIPDIPRGATITRVDNTRVANFFNIINALRTARSKDVAIDWEKDGTSGSTTLALSNLPPNIDIHAGLAESIPFATLEEVHKASSVPEALVMASQKCISFVVQTYVTLKQLVSRSVELKAMSGPVGIATVTYQAVEQSFTSFLYLLAFISANLAVVNFLPIPVVDGGVFVLLIIEKLKGGPISMRAQEIITYAGLVLIASVFIYLTYNDIVRLIFG